MGFSVASLYVALGLTVDRSWGDGQKKIIGLKTALLGIATGATLGAITNIVKTAAEAGTSLIRLSRATGLTTQSIQEYSYVAQQAGGDTKQFITGIGKLETSFRNFAAGRGGKALAATMAELKVTQADAAKAMRTPGGLNAEILKLSDRLHKITGPEQAALLRQTFGPRAAAGMAPLTEGAEALRAKIQHLHDIGGVVDDKGIENLKKFDNSMKDIRVSLHGLAMNVVGALAPALTDMAQRASKWIAENRELISGALTTAVKVLAAAFSALGTVISVVGNTIKWLFGGSDGATAILIGLAAAIMSVVIPAVVAWAAAMIPLAIEVLAVTWPFLALVAIIAAVAYGISKLIKYGPQIMAALGGAWDWIKGKVSDFWESIKALPGRLKDAFERMGAAIKQAISDAIDFVMNKIREADDAIENSKIGRMLSRMGQFATGVNIEGVRAMRHGVEASTAAAKKVTGAAKPAASSVSIGATTMNFNGVKDAADAAHKIGDEHERRMRELAAVHGGS